MHAVQENGASFEGSMLKLLRTLPKVLKYLPSDKAAVRLPLPPFLSLSLSLSLSLLPMVTIPCMCVSRVKLRDT